MSFFHNLGDNYFLITHIHKHTTIWEFKKKKKNVMHQSMSPLARLMFTFHSCLYQLNVSLHTSITLILSTPGTDLSIHDVVLLQVWRVAVEVPSFWEGSEKWVTCWSPDPTGASRSASQWSRRPLKTHHHATVLGLLQHKLMLMCLLQNQLFNVYLKNYECTG